MLELVDDSVVLLHFGLVVVLIELGVHVFGRVRVLMRQCWVGLVVDIDILLQKSGVGLLFGVTEQAEGVIGTGAESGHGSQYLTRQHRVWITIININQIS
jgi:hypothetical protein